MVSCKSQSGTFLEVMRANQEWEKIKIQNPYDNDIITWYVFFLYQDTYWICEDFPNILSAFQRLTYLKKFIGIHVDYLYVTTDANGIEREDH